MKPTDPSLERLATARGLRLLPYGLDESTLQRALASVFEHRTDYADLYFQYTRSESYSLEEGIVKSGSFGIDQGVGVRAVAGDKTAFSYSDDISEEALLQAGVPLRHIERGSNVPMYRTSVPTAEAGPFHGPMVVSMRPMKPADAIRAIQVTTRFPTVHGAPVHIGKPELIGIKDLAKPDHGDAVPVRDDELPVFWACGVTPQAVVATVKPEFCITHYPGCMLVTDRRNAELAIM